MKKKRDPDLSPPEVISIRLQSDHAKKLSEKARKYGLSSHEYVRLLVNDDLDDTFKTELLRALQLVHSELAKMREDLKEVSIAILCDAGKLERSDAELWVSERLFLPE
jgi:hypothetical protein